MTGKDGERFLDVYNLNFSLIFFDILSTDFGNENRLEIHWTSKRKKISIFKMKLLKKFKIVH